MIEILLLQCSEDGYVTKFFDGLVSYRWPPDALSWTRTVCGSEANVASISGLKDYRANHDLIAQAREKDSRNADMHR